MDNEKMESSISVREILSILFYRKKYIVAISTTIILVSFFLTFFFISPTFESNAKLIINTSDLIVPFADAPPMSDFEKLTSFHTQKEIIKSITIITPVVDVLALDKERILGNIEQFKNLLRSIKRFIGKVFGIDSWSKEHDPSAASINAVLENLKIITSPDSKAIKIQYRSKSATESADTLNAIIYEYIKFFNKLIKSRASGITDYLESRVQQVKAEMEDAELELLKFKEKDQFTFTTKSGKKEFDSLVGITDSTKIKNELVIYLLAMEDELRKKKNEYPATDNKIVTLKKKIKNYIQVINDMPRRELELHRLKREVNVKQDSYLFIQKNLEKAKIVQAGNTAKINIINIIEEAKEDDNPVSPKKKLIVIAALVFSVVISIVFSFILNFLDHSLRSGRELKSYCGIKLIGSIKNV